MYECFLLKLFEMLDEFDVSYAVARDYEGLPAKLMGNDLDIIVSCQSRLAIKKLFKVIPGSRVVNITSRSYVDNYYFLLDNNVSIQIDIISDYVWRGYSYFNVGRILSCRTKLIKENFSFYRVGFRDEALIKLIPYFLSCGQIKDKYVSWFILHADKVDLEVFQSLNFTLKEGVALQFLSLIGGVDSDLKENIYNELHSQIDVLSNRVYFNFVFSELGCRVSLKNVFVVNKGVCIDFSNSADKVFTFSGVLRALYYKIKTGNAITLVRE